MISWQYSENIAINSCLLNYSVSHLLISFKKHLLCSVSWHWYYLWLYIPVKTHRTVWLKKKWLLLYVKYTSINPILKYYDYQVLCNVERYHIWNNVQSTMLNKVGQNICNNIKGGRWRRGGIQESDTAKFTFFLK